MLLWGLGLNEAPDLAKWTEPQNPMSLFFLTGVSTLNPETVTRWLEKERVLRDSGELLFARQVGEAWNWRVRASYLRRIKEDPKEQLDKMPAGVKTLVRNIDSAIEQATVRALADKKIPHSVDEDFPVGERPFADLKEDEVTEIADITGRRLLALGWIFHANEWDISPSDVKDSSTVPSVWAPVEDE